MAGWLTEKRLPRMVAFPVWTVALHLLHNCPARNPQPGRPGRQAHYPCPDARGCRRAALATQHVNLATVGIPPIPDRVSPARPRVRLPVRSATPRFRLAPSAQPEC